MCSTSRTGGTELCACICSSRVFVGGSENSAVSLGFQPFGIILLAALMRLIGRVKSRVAWGVTIRCAGSRFNRAL